MGETHAQRQARYRATHPNYSKLERAIYNNAVRQLIVNHKKEFDRLRDNERKKQKENYENNPDQTKQ
jgi:hypothetical protein